MTCKLSNWFLKVNLFQTASIRNFEVAEKRTITCLLTDDKAVISYHCGSIAGTGMMHIECFYSFFIEALFNVRNEDTRY